MTKHLVVMFVALVAVIDTALADEPVDGGEVRDRAHERFGLGLAAGVRRSAAGTSQLGAGIIVRYGDGPYTLSAGLFRWSPVERDDHDHGWQLALRGYRHVKLGGNLRGHLVAGVNAERVTTAAGDGTSIGAELGVGVSMRLTRWLTGWGDVTLGRTHWLVKPPDRASASETTLMVNLGLAFD